MQTDTIAAIATALSDSGIGMIRISGENAISVADSVFVNKFGKRILLNAKSHTVHYGFFVDSSSSVIDEVMVCVMRAPKTYTTEDTVEISCHGGILVMKKILETVLHAGARLAEPGEFTKRAFLNGRIDLSKAEAVMDLIHSQNELALKSSLSQLRGDLSEKIKKFREDLLYEIAFIESALDDPEHFSLENYPDRLSEKLDNLITDINVLICSADNGRLVKEGISTVILGKPNVGKSSFLNILVGKERAIVTDVAGTTRDILEEHINLNGISLNIIDTAGIRDTNDIVEKIGVDRAKKYAKEADLIVYIVDSSVEIDESDKEIISLINGKNTIILLNKSDKESLTDIDDINRILKTEDRSVIKIIRTSTKDITDNEGISEFEKAVEDLFFSGCLKDHSEILITNTRHKNALQNALESLEMVKKSINDGFEEDFFSIDLMNAYSELGKIIGEEVEDDLVEEIFSKFCIGK